MERRRSTRKGTHLLVQYLAGNGEYQVDYASEVSQNGMFIRTERPFGVGDALTVQFAPRCDAGLVYAFCRVARVTPDGMAAEFLSLEDDAAATLSGALAG